MRTDLAALATLVTFAVGIFAWPASNNAAEPCCGIAAIDMTSRTVTARDANSGRTFRFKLDDARALRALKVGQGVYADFKTMKVSLNPDGGSPCCAIVEVQAPATTPIR